MLSRLLCVFALMFGPLLAAQPNVLWIVTDDQRYDSIRAFNQMIDGREDSALGYVESPNVDRLAAMGTTFINTHCHSPACAPSRAAMHYGRYPWKSGIYEFEYHNSSAEHWQPPFPSLLSDLGYQTFHVGKRGVRLKQISDNGKWSSSFRIYEQEVDFKKMAEDGLADWGKSWFHEIDGQKFHPPLKNVEFLVTSDGSLRYASRELENLMPKWEGEAVRTTADYDLLRHATRGVQKRPDKGMIIAGVSPRKAGKTRDGAYVNVLKSYLDRENTDFSVGRQKVTGVDPEKPLFVHLGFDFPHTPVLPPADYRARFRAKTYAIPAFEPATLDTMPEQMQTLVKRKHSDHLTDAEKQAMVQDYFAFCAYGDALVGEAVDAFIAYSEEQAQEWMIVYVCGDHGWKLNEHGAISKFTPWKIDTHNPVIVSASNKSVFPAGKVVRDFTEFVDVAPTILSVARADLSTEEYRHLDGRDLAKVAAGEVEARQYVVGESHAVTGPRAFIRTHEYAFSMKIRPNRQRGKNMNWAREADYPELDPGLYHLTKDPRELNNVAFDPKYAEVAAALRAKLVDIVLGDGRVEVDWGDAKALGTQIWRSDFAPGANDGKLVLPEL